VHTDVVSTLLVEHIEVISTLRTKSSPTRIGGRAGLSTGCTSIPRRTVRGTTGRAARAARTDRAAWPLPQARASRRAAAGDSVRAHTSMCCCNLGNQDSGSPERRPRGDAMPSTPKPGRPDSPAMRRHAVNTQARAPCRAHRPAPEQPGLRVLSEPDGIVSQGQWKTCFEPR
jgi:hypothetical protein